jgi:large subunit ribosomal protein L24
MPGHLQRVLQRAVRVEKHITKRYQAQVEAKDRYDYSQMQREINSRRRAVRRMHKDAKITSGEDWLLGPLAPRRDIGLKNDLGVLPREIANHVQLVKLAAKKLAEKARRGEPRNVFQVGDRAVVIRGIGKGIVGKISEIHWEDQTAALDRAVSVSITAIAIELG